MAQEKKDLAETKDSCPSNGKAGKYAKRKGGNNKNKGYQKKFNSSKKNDEFRPKDSVSPKEWDSKYSNDIGWWNKSPWYEDATNVPFNRIPGSPIDMKYSGIITNITDSVPGILTLGFHPTLGTIKDANSPVNRAFTTIYGDIYSRTSGAMQIQQADLAMFVVSMASVSCLIANVKRALVASKFWTGRNYYYPQALISAMNIRPSSIIGHQDEIRSRLNACIYNFNALSIPDFMSVFERQYVLTKNVYVDEDDLLGQMYVFVPRGYYKYVDTSSSCVYTDIIAMSGGLDVSVWLGYIEGALAAWRNSSDLGLICGSIQRAYKDNDLITIDYSADTDVVLPVCDRNINWQINNARTTQILTTSLNITQDAVANLLVQAPEMANSQLSGLYTGQNIWFLNSYDGDTSKEFQMESTRLMPILPTSGSFLSYWNTEIISDFRLYSIGVNGVLVETSFLSDVTTLTTTTMTNIQSSLKFIAGLSRFKHAPRVTIWLLDSISAPTTITNAGEFGDLYRYTTIDRDALIGLNNAALQSVFTVKLPSKDYNIR